MQKHECHIFAVNSHCYINIIIIKMLMPYLSLPQYPVSLL